ncbi:MAG: hypothetical protein JWQ04_3467, partial [Pedosphaera sp.]|nr:hypothetical protein [Pedosphaera sp.]
AVYFFLNQWPGTARIFRGLKEVAVGILFAAGTVIFVLPRSSSAAFRWPVTSWGLLCFLNCYAIAVWELEADRAEQQESLVTRWPMLTRYFRCIALLVALFALAPLAIRTQTTPPRLGLAMAASSLALAALDYRSGRLEADLLRISADLVLFTPLLFRFFPEQTGFMLGR